MSADPTDHVDLDVANHVAAALGHVRLRGPIAYLHRDTDDWRRILELTHRPLPLPLGQIPDGLYGGGHFGAVPVGQVTGIEIIDRTVWADATMVEAGPPGTRYGVGIDVDPDAKVVYYDVETDAEMPAGTTMFSDRVVRAVFLSAELMGATLNPQPAWPDAYLEVLAP